MIAVPMSPPSMISPSSSRPTGTSGTSMCFHWVSSRLSCLRASRSAPHSTRASLPNSLGWSWKGPPRWIQFWLPLTAYPYPGHLDQAHQEDGAGQQRVGQRAVQPHRHPRGGEQQHGAEDRREELLAEEVRGRAGRSCSAWIWEAEKTITRPSTVISRLLPRIR